MGRTQGSARRKARKQRTELPEVPDLGRLAMPRRGNRAAAKAVATGDLLWDKRRVARKEAKIARKRQEAIQNPPVSIRKHDLTRVLAAAPGWVYDHERHMFVPEREACAADLGQALAKYLSRSTKILLPAGTPHEDVVTIRRLIPRGHWVRARSQYYR